MDLARELHVGVRSIGRWERGEAVPRSSIGAIELLLGISLSANGTAEEVYTDPLERAAWEDLRLGTDAERREIIEGLRRARKEHGRGRHERDA